MHNMTKFLIIKINFFSSFSDDTGSLFIGNRVKVNIISKAAYYQACLTLKKYPESISLLTSMSDPKRKAVRLFLYYQACGTLKEKPLDCFFTNKHV